MEKSCKPKTKANSNLQNETKVQQCGSDSGANAAFTAPPLINRVNLNENKALIDTSAISYFIILNTIFVVD